MKEGEWQGRGAETTAKQHQQRRISSDIALVCAMLSCILQMQFCITPGAVKPGTKKRRSPLSDRPAV